MVRGIVLVAVALMVFQRAVPSGTVPMIDNSRSIGLFQRVEAAITNSVPTDAPNWIVQRYEDLTSSCAPAN